MLHLKIDFFKYEKIVELSTEKHLFSWISLSSKRFSVVSEQKKIEQRDFRFWPREKWNENQKPSGNKSMVLLQQKIILQTAVSGINLTFFKWD